MSSEGVGRLRGYPSAIVANNCLNHLKYPIKANEAFRIQSRNYESRKRRFSATNVLEVSDIIKVFLDFFTTHHRRHSFARKLKT